MHWSDIAQSALPLQSAPEGCAALHVPNMGLGGPFAPTQLLLPQSEFLPHWPPFLTPQSQLWLEVQHWPGMLQVP